MKRIFLFLTLITLTASAAEASVQQWQQVPGGAEFKTDKGLLRIEFVTDRIARVRSTMNGAFSTTPSLMRVPIKESAGKVTATEKAGLVELKSAKLTVLVDRKSGAVAYKNPNGQILLAENASQPRWFERTEVQKALPDPASIRKVQTVDGEREIASKFTTRKDRDAWKGGVKFRFAKEEALYGLGFDETADLNLRGKTKRLYQHNLRIVIPSIVSSKGYGLLFDAYSAMSFKDGEQGGSLDFDVIEDLDYYFISGPDMDGAVAGYRQLVGSAVMLPKWAFGYVQSKERYTSQDELISVTNEFRKRKIPLDVIVQDWNYWLQWGGDPNPKFYPDFTALTKSLHEQNTRLMISIWPNPAAGSSTGKALAAGGYVLPGTVYLDVFNPKAREVYWNGIWEILGKHGIDGWWCDSTEPTTADWGGKTRPADADEQNIALMAKTIDPQLLNAYALEDSTGIFENSRKSSPDKRVLNLTRSGYAGSQRTGSVLWTGDISASWNVFSQQVAALQSISAAGEPYTTFDIGAFFVKRTDKWFWAGDFNKGVNDMGYRELYTRWFQMGAFLPMFRSHGTDTPREPWRFGEPGTQFYDSILDSINLRYQLLPYFYSLASEVVLQNKSFMRPLVFSFPTDEKTHDLKSQFMVGDTFLVAPVLEAQQFGPDSKPIQNGPKTREVYLPKGAKWTDFWTGNVVNGGQTIQADAPISHLPLFVKTGSIVPVGPKLQFTGEQPGGEIEVRVYRGANGSFSLYEDEGDSYRYEQGQRATIPFAWNESEQTLTIGARKGEFPGMIKARTFRVVFVAENHGTGSNPTDRPDAVVQYSGDAIKVRAK